ncbi:hypothetical protein SteCoe_40045 [Stentor coeruleus]|uniref:Reverse transcriptase domain-containing protein n=1 Tax=Stentor coeruleus TaxID=5963 RepID=A0A1R2AKE0_9CILI|nr:hypothetical protein SteCoe_40045 [Stentor coeruleus]
MNGLGNKKATGPDGIPSELVKYGGKPMMSLMMHLMENILNTGRVPIEMKREYVVLIPKKKDSKQPQDMRPITLINSIYKLIDKLITEILKNDIETKKLMHEA